MCLTHISWPDAFNVLYSLLCFRHVSNIQCLISKRRTNRKTSFHSLQQPVSTRSVLSMCNSDVKLADWSCRSCDLLPPIKSVRDRHCRTKVCVCVRGVSTAIITTDIHGSRAIVLSSINLSARRSNIISQCYKFMCWWWPRWWRQTNISYCVDDCKSLPIIGWSLPD